MATPKVLLYGSEWPELWFTSGRSCGLIVAPVGQTED